MLSETATRNPTNNLPNPAGRWCRFSTDLDRDTGFTGCGIGCCSDWDGPFNESRWSANHCNWNSNHSNCSGFSWFSSRFGSSRLGSSLDSGLGCLLGSDGYSRWCLSCRCRLSCPLGFCRFCSTIGTHWWRLCHFGCWFGLGFGFRFGSSLVLELFVMTLGSRNRCEVFTSCLSPTAVGTAGTAGTRAAGTSTGVRGFAAR